MNAMQQEMAIYARQGQENPMKAFQHRHLVSAVCGLGLLAGSAQAAPVVKTVVVENTSAIDATSLRLKFSKEILPPGLTNANPIDGTTYARGNQIQKINAGGAAPTDRGSFSTVARVGGFPRLLDLRTADDEGAVPAAIVVRRAAMGPDQTRVDVRFDNKVGKLLAPADDVDATNYYNAGGRLAGAAKVLVADAGFERDPNTSVVRATITGDEHNGEFFEVSNVKFWTGISETQIENVAAVTALAPTFQLATLNTLNGGNPFSPNQSLSFDLGTAGDGTYVLMSYDLYGSALSSGSMRLYGSGMLSGSVVPEPAALAAIGGMLTLLRRRR